MEVVLVMRKTALIFAALFALTSLLLPPAFSQSTLQTFDDKAAFLAATGAASATGPLPDFGVVTGLGKTVGSITFAPLPGGPTMYIGGAGSEWRDQL